MLADAQAVDGDLKVAQPQEEFSEFYIRLHVCDESGVLADVTRVLSDEGISIASMIQHGETDTSSAILLLTTHKANEAAASRGAGEAKRFESGY